MRWLPPIGLLLSLTFLLHDGAMANDAHAPASDATWSTHPAAHAPLHNPAGADRVAMPLRTAAGDPDAGGCNVVRSAATGRDGSRPALAGGAAGIAALTLPPADNPNPPALGPPLDAGMRRALLQVYLI